MYVHREYESKHAVDGEPEKTTYHNNHGKDSKAWFVVDLQDSCKIWGIRVYLNPDKPERIYGIKVRIVYFYKKIISHTVAIYILVHLFFEKLSLNWLRTKKKSDLFKLIMFTVTEILRVFILKLNANCI